VFKWAKSGSASGSAVATAVTISDTGDVFVTGYFTGTVNFGGSTLTSDGANTDIFVAKWAPDGPLVWAFRYGGTGNDQALGIAYNTAAGVVVVGKFDGTTDFGLGPLTSAGGSDVFVLDVSGSDGSLLVQKSFGGSGDDVAQGVAAAAPNVFVIGTTNGGIDFGGGPLMSAGASDVFVVELTAGLQHVWSNRFGDVGTDFGNAIAVDSSGALAITGKYRGMIDFGGGMLASAGAADIFLAKLDASGNHIWSQHYGGAADDEGTGVAFDAAGDVILGGSFQAPVDFGSGMLIPDGQDGFVAVESTGGAPLWSRKIGGSGADVVLGVASVASSVSVVGSFEIDVDVGYGRQTSAGGKDIFVRKLAATDGSNMWSNVIGGAGIDIGRATALGAAGEVVLVGSFGATVDFGGGPLSSVGASDAFAARYTP
jgi:hypothetical protein